MGECRICGLEIRDGDDVVEADEHVFHVDCVSAPIVAKPPKPNTFAGWGSGGQMAMGDVQREP